MNLKNHITTPTVRSVLSFNDEEVTKALISYAKQHGYTFMNQQVTVWHPDKRDSERNLTKLAMDCPGNLNGIENP